MNCALLTIGTELTRGDLNDTNSGWLARRLSALGYEVTEMVSVDDDDARICAALRSLCARHEVVISTGGLGPTTDDRTTACAAEVLGVPLVRDEAALAGIRSLLERFGRTLSPSNAKQADFPEGATILSNTKGSAPGFMVAIDHARAFFMPGVPREMATMFEQEVVPRLPPRDRLFTTVRLRTFGMPEAEVNERLADLPLTPGITIGYRASHSDIEVKVLAEGQPGESATELETRAEAVGDAISERLGSAVYGRGEAHLPQIVGDLLVTQGASLGLAESCTGGLLSNWITQVPGASRYFKGGIVSYANTVKSQVLGVSELLLEK